MQQLNIDPEQQVKSTISRTMTAFIGGLLILLGLSFNKWAIEWLQWYYKWLIPFPGYLGYLTPIRIGLIIAFQVSAIFVGLRLLFKKPMFSDQLPVWHTFPNPLKKVLSIITILALVIIASLSGYTSLRAFHIIDPDREAREMLLPVEESEELIFSLTPAMKKLGKSLMNLSLPDDRSHSFFAGEVKFIDLSGDPLPNEPVAEESPLPALDIQALEWPVAAKVENTLSKDLTLWRPFLDGVEYFEYAKFAVKKGHFVNGRKDRFETTVLFDGRARLKSGELISIEGKQTVHWQQKPNQTAESSAGNWQIYKWRTESFKTLETGSTLFTEVLNTAIPNQYSLQRARKSVHEQLVIDFFLDRKNFKKPHKLFNLQSGFRHPGLSVVDLDRDGFDDLYVMPRWGKNMFFRNRGDGTFEEIAAELGLNIKDFTTSAIFADFDNDGDADVFLGRTFARSMYLMNENGRFVDRSDELINMPLPYLVVSMSVVDDNGDGLLDIYFSTYAIVRQSRRYKRYLSKADADELARLEELAYSPLADTPMPLNSPGPPNVFLRNLGSGRFTTAGIPEICVFRGTLQASWSDFDEDGDPDLYVANDLAPNNLFRNDGNGKFVDVTEQTTTADVGFGMGVTWGDYDNDGAQDMYISNMYSKAGQRIVAQLPGIDPRFMKAAHGNSLLRQVPSDSMMAERHFEKVSGLTAPDLLVEKAGWGWGSQFMDVDNDGYLDIYALSGFYTAPKAIAQTGDI